MKEPTLTDTNFGEFYLAFIATVRKMNYLIGMPLDDLLVPYAVGNDNATWNY